MIVVGTMMIASSSRNFQGVPFDANITVAQEIGFIWKYIGCHFERHARLAALLILDAVGENLGTRFRVSKEGHA
jgi:hypothetical protein